MPERLSCLAVQVGKYLTLSSSPLSQVQMIKRIKNHNELFDHKECVQILDKVIEQQKNKKGIHNLLDFKVLPELSSIGYLGEYFHLYLNYKYGNDNIVYETRLFVKSIPYQNADMCEFIEKSGMMKKEITLYGKLLNKLQSYSKNIWCAHGYLAREDLFVMQNITDIGYAPLPSESNYLSEAQLLPLLRSLATMHACSIAYELENNTNIGEELKDILIEVTVHPSVVWYTAGLKAVLAVALEHPKYQSPAMQSFIKEELPTHLETVYDMVNPSNKHRNVFCHRDIWGGNIFYHKTKPFDFGCVFVDFQLSRYSPPALDILMALHLNVQPAIRKEIMSRCCQYYYDTFTEELKTMGLDAKKVLDRTEFEKSLQEFELFGASYNCLSATVLRVPDNFLKNLKDNHPEDFHRYTNVERTEDVLELMRSNDEFRTVMHDTVEDMLEVALKNKI